ncbi:2-polyprenyl-6-methoxyphenol hydroxylase [Saccharopolyspora antimicrobica]|uniref:2-polyprenyl-6-methoxyphenol hydroxylase n=1 Tax=Saccharopolyspora antimicrobica TaxID=455193 RepID=A0A1I5GAM9_9PSEU|nr:FAD-dependent monooxygenase [Saccharopolyspora antimicrobica]RKT83845.1 2-polyprenyl-6-methoxyphenol hydroxylase-like FAD-dependent oxidoreductase [Saccharopolyspora antimicrobica]SFO32992.1 2-polyprenyl-6-methoxyphenol hydroxylase [Saccharopolyspora antimicrobica]
MSMRVAVVGGGIGGLALGAGLRRSGYEVAVFDRDTDVAATGGYHITLDQRAQSALARLVEPETVRRLLASGSALRLRERDAFWDRRGRLLGHGPDLSGSASIDVDRITLRTLLAEAVGEDLHLGRDVSSVDQQGEPRVMFADGTSVTADLVVGADGAHSLVARHLAAGPTNRPAGIIGFSGRTGRTDLSAVEQQRLGLRSSMAVGPRGAALYIGFLDPVGNAALDAPELRMSVTTGPTYIWGAMFPESAGTDALRELSGTRLQTALLDGFRARGWAEHALEVIARADPASVAAFRFNAASTRAGDLAPWKAGRITALGDAVHATPPTAGMGAGAAIRDAADLLDHLNTATDDTTLTGAIARFETGMRQRGAEVLTLAMKTVRLILATDTTLGAAATTMAAPILAAATRLRR